MKKLFTILFLSISGQALACPTCMSDPESSKVYLIVIWVFIGLIYIPMFFIFKAFIKNRNINKANEN